jgi:WD40 repeat protein
MRTQSTPLYPSPSPITHRAADAEQRVPDPESSGGMRIRALWHVIAIAAASALIREKDCEEGRDATVLATIRREKPIISIAPLDSTGCIASVAEDGKTVEIDDVHGVRRATLRAQSIITTIALFPSNGTRANHRGPFLVSGGRDGKLRLWDDLHVEAADRQPLAVLTGHIAPISTLAVLAAPECASACTEPGMIISGSDDKSIIVWNAISHEQMFHLRGHQSALHDIKAFRDAQHRPWLLSIGFPNDDHPLLWDLSTGTLNRTLTELPKAKLAVIQPFLWKGTETGELPTLHMASARINDRRGVITVWNLLTMRMTAELKGHGDAITSLATIERNDDMKLVSGSADGQILMWSLTEQKVTHTFEGHSGSVTSLAIYGPHKDPLVASASQDGTIKLHPLPSPLFMLSALLERDYLRNNAKLKQLVQELDSLIGLTEVKATAAQLIDFALSVGHNELTFRHMVFLGPPGTGKTRVAKIMAEILVEIQMVKRFVNVENMNQIVGGFVNAESGHIHDFFKNNTDSVIFIDEAHQLGLDPERARLRLSVVNKYMSDHAKSLILIFAGYETQINDLLYSVEPGLRSRIRYSFNFRSYSDVQLARIFQQQLGRYALGVEELALARFFNQSYNHFINDGGMGRAVLNLAEQSKLEHQHAMSTDCEEWQPYLLRMSHIENAMQTILGKNVIMRRLVDAKTIARRAATVANLGGGLMTQGAVATKGQQESKLSANQPSLTAEALASMRAEAKAAALEAIAKERDALKAEIQRVSKELRDSLSQELREEMDAELLRVRDEVMIKSAEMRANLSSLRQDVRNDVNRLEAELSAQKQRISSLEATVAMHGWLLAVLGLVVILLCVGFAVAGATLVWGVSLKMVAACGALVTCVLLAVTVLAYQCTTMLQEFIRKFFPSLSKILDTLAGASWLLGVVIAALLAYTIWRSKSPSKALDATTDAHIEEVVRRILTEQREREHQQEEKQQEQQQPEE